MIKKILEISLNRIIAAFGLGGLSDYNTDKGLVIIFYCILVLLLYIEDFWLYLSWMLWFWLKSFGDDES